MVGKPLGNSAKVAKKATAKPTLLAGGNPQIAWVKQASQLPGWGKV